ARDRQRGRVPIGARELRGRRGECAHEPGRIRRARPRSRVPCRRRARGTRRERPVIRVGVIGANGYTGSETVRWLLEHPDVSLDCVVSRTHAGRPLADVVPALAGLTDLRCEDVDVGRLEKLDAVFLATTHGAARELATMLERAPLLLDLSMDHRLEATWAYGLVEWNAERIAMSRRIA